MKLTGKKNQIHASLHDAYYGNGNHSSWMWQQDREYSRYSEKYRDSNR